MTTVVLGVGTGIVVKVGDICTVSSVTFRLLYMARGRYESMLSIHVKHRPKRWFTASDGRKAYM